MSDPWYTVLAWAVLSSDFKTGKVRSFTGTVITEFEKWSLQKRPPGPTKNIQDRVFFCKSLLVIEELQ